MPEPTFDHGEWVRMFSAGHTTPPESDERGEHTEADNPTPHAEVRPIRMCPTEGGENPEDQDVRQTRAVEITHALTAQPFELMMSYSSPIKDTQPRPVERRVIRHPLPPCEACGGTDVHVATRTEGFVYMRWRDCLNTWSVLKTAWPEAEGSRNEG